MPEWQRIAGKAAKEVEKFAKEKADLVLMHWRDKMGIAQKEVSILVDRKLIFDMICCCCCSCCCFSARVFSAEPGRAAEPHQAEQQPTGSLLSHEAEQQI